MCPYQIASNNFVHSTFKYGDYIKLTVDGTGQSPFITITFVFYLIFFVACDFLDPDSAITGAVITKMPTNGMLYAVSRCAMLLLDIIFCNILANAHLRTYLCRNLGNCL